MVAIALAKNGKLRVTAIVARGAARLLSGLASHNTALALMGLLLLSLAAQAALPQRGVATELQYTTWRAHYPLVARVAEAAGLDRVAAMPWFWVIGIMLALALGVSVSRRAWRLATGGASPRGPRVETLLLEATDAPARVKSLLRHAGYRVSRQSEGIVARKGALGPWGSLLFHGGLLVLITGAFLSAATRFVGYVELAPGQVFQERSGYAQQRGALASSQPLLTAYLQDLAVGFWPDGSVKTVAARAALNNGSGDEDQGDIGRNGSLRVGATTLTLGSPLGPAVLLRYTAPGAPQASEGYLNFYEVSGRLVNRVDLPGAEVALQSELFGDWRSALEGKAGAPNVWLEVRPANRAPGAPREKLSLGSTMSLAGGELEFAAMRPWALFMVSRDVGYPVLLAGAALAILGLTLALFIAPRWAFLSRSGDGWRMALQGPGSGRLLERELRSFAARLSPPVQQ